MNIIHQVNNIANTNYDVGSILRYLITILIWNYLEIHAITRKRQKHEARGPADIWVAWNALTHLPQGDVVVILKV